MPSPFPGMNLYLENSRLWAKVHKRLIVAIADFLSPQLRPKYIVDIEERVYQTNGEDALLVGIPDIVVQRQITIDRSENNVAIAVPAIQPLTVTIPTPEIVREWYLEVRDVATKEVVTSIELLSPKNKLAGEGRRTYQRKRLQVLGSLTHLVEIDLLRVGQPMTILNSNIQSHYRILVSRSDRRPLGDLYAFNLRDPIPSFPLPLRDGDAEHLVDLQTLINGIYERGSYDLVIDYNKEPVPALSETDTAWTDALLREKGLRLESK